MISAFRWAIAFGLLASCGDDAAPADSGSPDARSADAASTDADLTDSGPTDAGPTDAGSTGWTGDLPRVSLDVTATAWRPGIAPHLRWTVTGGEELEVVVLVIEPGAARLVVDPAHNLYLDPGASPATGEVREIHRGRAASGELDAAAFDALGEWRFFAELRTPGEPGFVVRDDQRVLVADAPLLQLRPNRLAGSTFDRFEVSAVLAAGDEREVTVYAWLEDLNARTRIPVPDPGVVPAASIDPVYRGPATDTTLSLLSRTLEVPALGGGGPVPLGGEGRYEMHARLVDATTGALLTTAAASFEVCDVRETVRGTVRSSTGGALGGGSPARASIYALDLVDGASVGETTLDGAGGYSTTLPAGRYVLITEVWDETGRHFGLSPPFTLRGGCRELTRVVDVTTAPPLAMPPPAAMAGSAPAALMPADRAADGCKRPRVLYRPVKRCMVPDEFLYDWVGASLLADNRAASGAPNLDIIDLTTISPILQIAATRMGIGEDVDIEGIKDALGSYRYDLSYTANWCVRDSESLTLLLVDLHTRETIRRAHQYVRGRALDYVVGELYAELGGANLFEQLRASQERPIEADLSLAVMPPRGAPESTFDVVATLRDCDGTTPAGLPITFAWSPPEFEGRTVMTGAGGVARTTYTAGRFPGAWMVTATLRTPTRSWSPTPPQAFEAAVPGDVGVQPESLVVRPGERTNVTVHATRAGAAIGDALIQVRALGGTVMPEMIRTGPTGTATVSFVAGARAGSATVEAQVIERGTGRAEARLFIDPRIRVEVDAMPRTTTVGGTIDVTGSATSEGSPLAGATVSFSGTGYFIPPRTTTDREGRFATTFTAPGSGNGETDIQAIVGWAGTSVFSSVHVAWTDPALPPPPEVRGSWNGTSTFTFDCIGCGSGICMTAAPVASSLTISDTEMTWVEDTAMRRFAVTGIAGPTAYGRQSHYWDADARVWRDDTSGDPYYISVRADEMGRLTGSVRDAGILMCHLFELDMRR